MMQAITRVLPVASGHSLLVLLSEDGLVQLVDCDSLEAQALPLGWVGGCGWCCHPHQQASCKE